MFKPLPYIICNMKNYSATVWNDFIIKWLFQMTSLKCLFDYIKLLLLFSLFYSYIVLWYLIDILMSNISKGFLINILSKVAPVLNYFNFTSIQKMFLEWNLLYESFFFVQTIIYFSFLKEKFLPFIVNHAWNDINQWLLSLPIILLRSHRLHAAFVHVADQL